VHSLPKRPSDIEDDGEFHFAILGPRATSDSGKPSTDARRYIDETTGPDKPRAITVTPSFWRYHRATESKRHVIESKTTSAGKKSGPNSENSSKDRS
jgi:hypothetical protein